MAKDFEAGATKQRCYCYRQQQQDNLVVLRDPKALYCLDMLKADKNHLITLFFSFMLSSITQNP